MAGQRYRAAVCATGLCRLAGVYGPDHRLYGPKESVVSTLTILYGSSAAFAAALSPAAAAPLLVFCLLYTPCIAAVASVKRELGGRWAFIMVANQCIVAWLAAFGHAAHHDAVKKTETGSGLQDAGRSFSLDNRCVFVLLLLQI